MTKFQRSKIEIGKPWCVNCEIEVETILHALHDCPNAMVLWIDVIPLDVRNWLFSVDLVHWIEFNLSSSHVGKLNIGWKNY